MAKSKAYKERVRQQKLKYRAVRNITGNSSLAKTLSTKSVETIYEQYGIKVEATRVPRLKKVSEAQIQKVDKQIQNWLFASTQGYTKRERETVKDKDFEYIQNNTPKEVRRDIFSPLVDKFDTTEDRRKQWKRWSAKNSELPDIVIDTAEAINKRMRFDDESAYGYAVAYYMYTENVSEEDALQFLKADKFNGGEIYIDTRKQTQ